MISAAQTHTPRELLGTGELILLPSDAAALRFRRIFDADQQAAGRRAWQPANVLSWSQWANSMWGECIVLGLETRLLLNDAQEHQLWRDIIANAQENSRDTLNSADSLAELARSAWHLADSYGATRQLRSSASTHDARIFASWADEFNRACQRHDYLSRASVEAALAEHINTKSLGVSAKLHVAGFLDLTPQQHLLLEAASNAGTSITISQLAAPCDGDAKRLLLRADSEEEELRAIAVWARRFLEARADSTAQVGIVLPDIDADRPALEANLREIICPELQLIGGENSATPYEFASSGPLAYHPMIAAALDLAHFASGALPLTNISALLVSPYLNSAGSLNQGAQFDACVLRQTRMLRPDLSLTSLLRLAQSSEFGATPLQWIKPLHQFLAQSGNLQTPRSFAEWSELIRRLLRAATWPGQPADAEESQLAHTWDHVLDSVATLDFGGRRVSFYEALDVLEKQVSKTPIARSAQLAPVQVLRPSDLPGMSFDALIYARATDKNLPITDKPNPLIDWKLQGHLNMPGADRALASQRAQLQLENAIAAGTHVLFTYASNNSEGKQRLSLLISRRNWSTEEATEVLTSAPAAEHVDVETFADATSLPPLTSSKVHGGASVLQHQAACGFRAFAEIRLRATELEAREIGFDLRESGDLLHRVMSHFWNEAKSQAGLRSMTRTDRHQLLTRSIDDAFSRMRSEGEWENAYIHVQKQRLVSLLDQWLDQELKRAPFTVVDTERKENVSIGPLDLTVRIDRIDSVEGLENSSLLVDYKTGLTASPKDWLGERPDEPQLPLYALLPEAGTLAGLAFAKVRAGDAMSWQGYASVEGALPVRNSVRDMQLLVEEWHQHLQGLAEAFAAGDASVRPKNYPVTCTHCSHRLLCRLDPTTLLATSEVNNEEDAPG